MRDSNTTFKNIRVGDYLIATCNHNAGTDNDFVTKGKLYRVLRTVRNGLVIECNPWFASGSFCISSDTFIKYFRYHSDNPTSLQKEIDDIETMGYRYVQSR